MMSCSPMRVKIGAPCSGRMRKWMPVERTTPPPPGVGVNLSRPTSASRSVVPLSGFVTVTRMLGVADSKTRLPA
jgi:hypothetical protein